MASVSKTSGPKPWQVRWRDEAGQQRKRSFPRQVDAKRFQSEVEHSLNTGTYVDPAAGRVRFRDYAESWRLAQPHRQNTITRTASQLNRHVYPVLGGRPIAAIRPSEVQAFATGLSATLAPTTVRTVFSCVRAVFASAMRDRLIGRDPAERIALPELRRDQVVPLTVDQVDQLVDALPVRYRAVGVVAAGAGLRRGELFGLQVRDIDFLRRTLAVERQVHTAAGGSVVGPLKTKSSYRTVPLGDVVVTALSEHLRRFPAAGEAFVFAADDGGPVSPAWFTGTVWAAARKAARVPGAGMHDLRHFFASALIRSGLSVKVVSARLGHSNAAMTLNVYSHLWPDDEDRTRQAIDSVFRRDVPRLRPVGEA